MASLLALVSCDDNIYHKHGKLARVLLNSHGRLPAEDWPGSDLDHIELVTTVTIREERNNLELSMYSDMRIGATYAARTDFS